MQLSIIIVNYNVKYFLEQCLYSVQQATRPLQAEIFVVDNCSTDNSISYLSKKFPQVIFIANAQNVGFGKANNMAAEQSKGKYIVYLNPDTIVSEDCFIKCLQFFESHPQCGCLGVRMIDGSGQFLPESKRAYPSPLTSFFKLTGLARLFPTSAFFNRYALGHLNEHEVHEADVLAGAFMMLPHHICQKTGGFDETFFMYGEDIDLSYRIKALGYQNYYLGNNTIIHFKGESTKKGSLNYVWMFYEAMIIFVRKHYHRKKAFLFVLLIQTAIVGRAAITLCKNVVNKVGLPLLDFCFIQLALVSAEHIWISQFRGGMPFFQPHFLLILTGFSFSYFVTAAVTGFYDYLYKPSAMLSSLIAGTTAMIAAYSLLPEDFRFSRGVILLGGALAMLLLFLLRITLRLLGWIPKSEKSDRKIAIVGNEVSYHQAFKMLQNAKLETFVVGHIDSGKSNHQHNNLGTLEHLQETIHVLGINEIIFCIDNESLSYQKTIDTISALPSQCSYRLMAKDSNSMVGSDSKATIGEAVAAEPWYNILQPEAKRTKRLLDILFVGFALFLSPFYLFQKGFSLRFFTSLASILTGKQSWIGFACTNPTLPTISKGFYTHFGSPFATNYQLYSEEALLRMDVLYATQYTWGKDFRILVQLLPQLHRALS